MVLQVYDNEPATIESRTLIAAGAADPAHPYIAV
jgi:hypothetical protein